MAENETVVNQPEESPLESWKAIAAYLQRNVVTVRRWEKDEGLPVHRHSHKSRASVYAYPSEIDAWRATRKASPESRPLWKTLLTGPRSLVFASALASFLVMVGNGVRPQVVSAQTGLESRQLWSGEGVDSSGSVSRDGRLISFTDWSTGDLALRDLTTGGTRRLITNLYATASLISPDGHRLIYAVSAGPREVHGRLGLITITPDSKPKVLLDNAEFRGFQPTAWSRDGRSVLSVVSRQDSTVQLAWISIEDGSVRVLKSFGWIFPVMASISPDGHWIAYSVPRNLESSDSSVYILAEDGTKEIEAIKGTSANESPLWSMDGTRLYFTSNRSGTFGLWWIPVHDGNSGGNPVLVKPDIGRISAKGFTRGGSFVYVSTHGGTNVLEAELDRQGKVHSPGMLISESYVGSNQFAEWSPDGKQISFLRARNSPDGGADLVVRELDSGRERTYSAPGVPSIALQRAVWFRDGNRLLQLGYDSRVRTVLYLIDLERGHFERLLTLKTHPPFTSRWALSPDERSLYGQTSDGVVSAFDLESGARRDVFVAPAKNVISSLALSPDGRKFGFNLGTPGRGVRGVFVVGVDGKDVREVYSRPSDPAFGIHQTIAWTRDSQSILFIEAVRGGEWRLMRVPGEGGTPESLGLSSKAMRHLALSPDGSRLAYTGGDAATAEWWALDNMLPDLK